MFKFVKKILIKTMMFFSSLSSVNIRMYFNEKSGM